MFQRKNITQHLACDYSSPEIGPRQAWLSESLKVPIENIKNWSVFIECIICVRHCANTFKTVFNLINKWISLLLLSLFNRNWGFVRLTEKAGKWQSQNLSWGVFQWGWVMVNEVKMWNLHYQGSRNILGGKILGGKHGNNFVYDYHLFYNLF